MKNSNLLLILVFLISFFFQSCGSGDDNNNVLPHCTGSSIVANINGDDSFRVITAWYAVGAQSETTERYSINVQSLNNTCQVQDIMQITFEKLNNAGMEGTYPLVQSESEINEAFAIFSTAPLNGNDLNTLELVSGSVVITKNNGNNYTIALNGTLENNESFTFDVTSDFVQY